MTLLGLMQLKYPNGLDYLTLIQDSELIAHLPKGYLPEIITTGSNGKEDVFLKPFFYVTASETGVERVYYLYMNTRGELKNNAELSMVQMNRKYKGFLARLHIPANSMTPENLVLDYIIDLQHIRLNVNSGIQAINSEISESSLITFDSIDRTKYPDIKTWYEPLFNFDYNRTDVFELLNG